MYKLRPLFLLCSDDYSTSPGMEHYALHSSQWPADLLACSITTVLFSNTVCLTADGRHTLQLPESHHPATIIHHCHPPTSHFFPSLKVKVAWKMEREHGEIRKRWYCDDCEKPWRREVSLPPGWYMHLRSPLCPGWISPAELPDIIVTPAESWFQNWKKKGGKTLLWYNICSIALDCNICFWSDSV